MRWKFTATDPSKVIAKRAAFEVALLANVQPMATISENSDGETSRPAVDESVPKAA
ncbi:hypothetical protein ACFQ68_00155 [Amycolatopsis japonica]|uniref:hypothetical protein n=1 Tax=Amycolatopsis japonica TaxID=208439 RepID=UPI00366C3CF1